VEQAVRAVPMSPPGLAPDAVLRVAYPYNFAPTAGKRLLVFGTAECSVCPKDAVVGAGGGQIGAALEEAQAILLTPSEWSRRGFLRSGANPARVVVVPHGVDRGIFQPVPAAEEKSRLRQKLGLQDEHFVFLNVGSLTPNKGIHVLLKAFVAVAAAQPRARLVLKYNESLYSAKALIASLPETFTAAERAVLTPAVQLVGGVHTMSGLAALYQAADAYVAPYHAEGFNLPALEACACGLPVICTAGGPTDEFLPEGVRLPIVSTPLNVYRDGLAMTVLNPDRASLAGQMDRALRDGTVAHQARIAGPRHVAANYTWGKVCERLVHVALH
jgi:glycosyltransferase involved in cell wall biosynthesis